MQPEPAPAGPAAAEAQLRGDMPDAETGALAHVPSYARFLGVAALGLTIDLWSKHWAFATLGQGNPPRVIVPYVLEFQTMLNPGALFGIGGGQTMLFLIASLCALLLVFWMFSQTSPRRWMLQIALGGILAGALGNMYDRVVVKLLEKPFRHAYVVKTGETERGVVCQVYPPRPGGREIVLAAGEELREAGFVRDFIKIPTTLPNRDWVPAKIRGKELWPWVFNVADMLLVGGVGILAIHLWRDRKHPPKAKRIAVDAPGSTA